MKKTKEKSVRGRDSLSGLIFILKARGLSLRTQKIYLHYNRNFIEFTGKSAKSVTDKDIKKYLAYLFDRGVSNSTLNLAVNALKLYYGSVMRRKLFFDFKRPKRETRLPAVLTEDEVKRIIEVTKNLKHKLMLSLMYSSGLRVSELIKLKVGDLYFEEGIIRVNQGKGSKDRQTVLSSKLSEYLKIYLKNKGKDCYVFSGRDKSSHLTTRTLQQVFYNSLQKSEITKKASCHSLRHSFATHLLEKGVDIRYIQKLLGHKRLETTQIYTKVTTKKLRGIKSPFDEFFE